MDLIRTSLGSALIGFVKYFVLVGYALLAVNFFGRTIGLVSEWQSIPLLLLGGFGCFALLQLIELRVYMLTQ